MLFNSYEFIFIFIPLVLSGYYLSDHLFNKTIQKVVLVTASLFFYGYWNHYYLPLIVLSVLFNYFSAIIIYNQKNKAYLLFAISVNLFSIVYFKYANFFIENINHAFGSSIIFEDIILPLAISFFTFQQISFLVDVYRDEIEEIDFLDYSLFVTFFPQLIAGPIVHHKEIIPQFNKASTPVINWEFIAIGIAIFCMGLFKKVVIADDLASNVTLIFSNIEQGQFVSFLAAWSGAVGYSFQLYFDFSGYSDMAFGLALLFGVKLPINFFSPYRSANIIIFWRTWHISLSRFLRDYVYFTLGGSKHGPVRKSANLMITMLLGGLWHGAGWAFVIWGGIHGALLILNNAWRSLKKLFHIKDSETEINYRICQLFTFLCVTLAWVFFRSESLDGALHMFWIMFGLEGINISHKASQFLTYLPSIFIASDMIGMFEPIGDAPTYATKLIVLYLWVIFLPNPYELFKLYHQKRLHSTGFKFNILFKPNAGWAFLLAVIFYVSISNIGSYSEFLYFRF
ncbi:MAG: MBOAT family O-acyltransferase [Halopseudomonas aestusnigri]